jgi:hypothetical protein
MIIQTDLPAGDLIAMLDHGGKPGALSLRPGGKASPLSEALIASLEKAGLVKPGEKTIKPSAAGRIVANVLLSPYCYIQLCVWNNEMEGHLRAAFPASPAVGTGVIINQSGGTVHLQGFVDDQVLIELINPVVNILPEAAPSFDASLTFEQAIILAAMLEMIVSDRRERPQSRRIRPFNEAAISEWLDFLWAGGGRASLSGQVFSLALNPDPPNPPDLNNFLEELAKGGLLTKRNGAADYLPTDALLSLIAVLNSASAGFDLERVDRTKTGPLKGRIVHVLSGLAGAFILELAGADRIHIQVADRAATIAVVTNILVRSLAQNQSQATEPTEVPHQPNNRNRFCTHCGKPLEPSWRFCKACGNRL